MQSAPSLIRASLALLLCSACAAPPTGAGSAQRGFYLKGYGGLGTLEDEELVLRDGGTETTSDGEFDSGFLAGAAIGYRFDDHWALEIDYGYRSNDVSRVTSAGSALADSGDYASTMLTLNALYRWNTDWRFDPYVGIGLGYTTEVDIDLAGPGFTGEESFSGDTPAGQYMVGIQGPITESLDLFVEGRFARAFNPEMGGENNARNVDSEYGHFGLLFGLSWGF